jgi:hypothetical protein
MNATEKRQQKFIVCCILKNNEKNARDQPKHIHVTVVVGHGEKRQVSNAEAYGMRCGGLQGLNAVVGHLWYCTCTCQLHFASYLNICWDLPVFWARATVPLTKRMLQGIVLYFSKLWLQKPALLAFGGTTGYGRSSWTYSPWMVCNEAAFRSL